MENFHFFLSYSRNIYFEIVEKIVKELERYGLTIWLDKTEVSLGCQIYDNINLTLKKALEYHGAILIIDKLSIPGGFTPQFRRLETDVPM